MEPEKTPNCQEMLKKKNKAGGITLPDFMLYYKAVITRQHGIGTRPIDQ